MRIRLQSPFGPAATAALLHAAAKHEDDAFAEHFRDSSYIVSLARYLLRHPAPPRFRVRITGERVEVETRDPSPGALTQRMRGRIREEGGGAVLEGRLRASWWGLLYFAAYFALTVPLWLLAGIALIRGGAEASSLTPLFTWTSVLVGAGTLFLGAHRWAARREREAILRFLRGVIPLAVEGAVESEGAV